MGEAGLGDAGLLRVAEDPRYHALVRARTRLSWTLTAAVVTIFFGYMLLVAFQGPLLGRPIAGLHMTIGIPVGLGVILSGILFTALYVRIANRRFDAMLAALLADHRP